MSNSPETQKPIVSVIIPVLNNRVQLGFCLDSLPNEQLDIIVIDGGSSDGTLSVIQKYSDIISFWESGQDSGIADAFNRGIRKAKGEIITILNSDDYWHKDTLRTIVHAYSQSPDVDIFYGDLQFVNEEFGESYIKKPNLKKMKFRMNVFHPSMFVKRDAYLKVGHYRLDYMYAMDAEWCHRALQMGLRFHYVPNVLATMRLGGLSDRQFKRSLQEYKQSVTLHGLATPVEAMIYYYYFLLMKSLMKFSWLRTIKLRIERIIEEKLS